MMRCVAPIVGLLSQGLARVGVRILRSLGDPALWVIFSLKLLCLSACLLAFALARRLFSALGDIHPVSSFRFFHSPCYFAYFAS